MTAALIYFLKVNLTLSILFLAYYFLLRKEKFFLLNRAILLGVIGLAFLLPLLPSIKGSMASQFQREVSGISPFGGLEPFRDPSATIPASSDRRAVQLSTDPVKNSGSPFTVMGILQGLYTLVAFILLLRLAVQLYHLSCFIRKSCRERVDVVVYCYHEGQLPPFSFFRYLVLNPGQYGPGQAEQVIAHEKVHIRQGHSFDLLLAEFLYALLWINPLVAGLKRAIKLNLEYIADEKVLETGIDRRSYQFSLLSCLQVPGIPVVNLFTASKIKLRIHMMNTKRSPIRNLYKYALALPLLAGAYCIVNPLQALSMPVPAGVAGALPARDDLKAFEGYYQLDKDKDSYLQIKASEKGLILKQLWDDKEISFDQVSELEFSAMEGKFPLKFSKDASGAIVSVLAFNRDRWNKVKEYTPVVFITLRPEQLKPFAGYYTMRTDDGGDAYLQIETTNDGLLLRQGWDGQEIRFRPRSATEFYSKERAFPLEFTKDNNGNATQVMAFHRDLWLRVKDTSKVIMKRGVSLRSGQLKALEGKYHLQAVNGANANIQIRATETGIVLQQVWDGKEFQLLPSSATEFFSRDRHFPLVFTLDEGGNAKEMLAFNKDRWEKVKATKG